MPLFFSGDVRGAMFLSSDSYKDFSDDELTEILSGTAFLALDALEGINRRGFLKLTGVDCREWNGEVISGEYFGDNRVEKCPAQNLIKELVLSEGARADSFCCHSRGGKFEEKLFPAVSVFENSLGGTVVSFCGVPKCNYHYSEFSFLNRSRKKTAYETFIGNGKS